MDISKDLEMAIANDTTAIKSVDVTYRTGEEVSGFVKTAKFLPLAVTLCKHQTLKGDNPYHNLDFNAAIRIELLYHNGETKLFK